MLGYCVLITITLGLAALVSRSLKDLTDEELLARYNAGDMRAFDCLYQRHRKPIFNFILRSVHSPHRAEELMQEVFVRIVQNASGYVQEAKFTTWLYTIARNLCIDSYRRGKHRQTVSLSQEVGQSSDGDKSTLEQFIEDPKAKEKAEDRVFNKEVQDALYQAVDELSEPQREVFLLREVSHLAYQDIAAVVGISENTAKSRMRYALEHLRRKFESMGFSFDDLS